MQVTGPGSTPALDFGEQQLLCLGGDHLPREWETKELEFKQELKGERDCESPSVSHRMWVLAEQMGIPRIDNNFSGDSYLFNAFCLVS